MCRVWVVKLDGALIEHLFGGSELGPVLTSSMEAFSLRRSLLAAAASGAFVVAGLTGCGSRDGGQPPGIVQEAIDSQRLDQRAAETCTSGGVPPIAAFDSNASTIRGIPESETLADGFERSLPAYGEAYVAVCIYDATEIPGLDSGLNFFVLWETEWEGTAVLAAW